MVRTSFRRCRSVPYVVGTHCATGRFRSWTRSTFRPRHTCLLLARSLAGSVSAGENPYKTRTKTRMSFLLPPKVYGFFSAHRCFAHFVPERIRTLLLHRLSRSSGKSGHMWTKKGEGASTSTQPYESERIRTVFVSRGSHAHTRSRPQNGARPEGPGRIRTISQFVRTATTSYQVLTHARCPVVRIISPRLWKD